MSCRAACLASLKRLVVVALTCVGLAVVNAPAGATDGVGSSATQSDEGISSAGLATRAAPPRCSHKNRRPFRPIAATVGSIVSHAKVVPVNRTATGDPGTAPLTDAGKNWLAWDRPGIWPGSVRGQVLLNAHAWPDGSALGNRFSASLRPGAVVKVYGFGGRVQCYQVALVVTRPPSLAFTQYYYGTRRSAAMLAILTCSGTRVGPGHWTHRTVWMAKPIR